MKAIVNLYTSKSPRPQYRTESERRSRTVQMLVTIVCFNLTGLVADITVPSHILALNHERRKPDSTILFGVLRNQATISSSEGDPTR